MANYKVSVHRLAIQEIRDSDAYYRRISPKAADRFRANLRLALDRIATEGPHLPVIQQARHWVRVKKYPFILVFKELTPGTLIVVACAHTSRRTGYWRRRK